MSNQSPETCKPMIFSFAIMFILTSFRRAVPDGPDRLLEKTKRGGAGLLESMVKPQV